MCQLGSQSSGKWEWSPGFNSPQGTSFLYHHYSEDLKALTGTVHKPITNSGVRKSAEGGGGAAELPSPQSKPPASFKVNRKYRKREESQGYRHEKSARCLRGTSDSPPSSCRACSFKDHRRCPFPVQPWIWRAGPAQTLRCNVFPSAPVTWQWTNSSLLPSFTSAKLESGYRRGKRAAFPCIFVLGSS